MNDVTVMIMRHEDNKFSAKIELEGFEKLDRFVMKELALYVTSIQDAVDKENPDTYEVWLGARTDFSKVL
jgi:hypothetical protein